MNDTEAMALEWLTRQGIRVYYQHRKSPDFVTTDGKVGYEVKLVRSDKDKCVHFTGQQYARLQNFKGELYLLIFEPDETSPMKYRWDDVITDNIFPYRVRITANYPRIPIEQELYEQVLRVTTRTRLYGGDKQILQDWIADAIHEKLKKEQQGGKA